VFSISGSVVQSNAGAIGGIRLLKFTGSEESSQPIAVATATMASGVENEEIGGDIEISARDEVDEELMPEESLRIEMETSDKREAVPGSLTFDGVGIGTISVGEVQLKTLKEALEAAGVTVEYRLSSSGSLLVCGNQVLIRKGDENDFVLEGPPSAVYYDTRKILYKQLALV
jgi:hypothetical protein